MKKIKELIEKFPLPVLIVIAVILRLLFLGLRPFDGDEGIIIKIATSTNLKTMFAGVANDVHPPLFHFLEYLILHIFRLSEFSARLLPAICGILAIWPIYLVIKKISDQKTAFWVSLLSVFSSVLAYHSAEVRPYALFTLIFFWQFYLFLIIQEAKRANYLLPTTIYFAIASVALIFTQYIGFFVLAGELLYLILCNRQGITKKNIAAGLAAVLVFVAIWGKTFLHQLSGRSFEQSQTLNFKDNIIGVFNAIYRFGAGRLFLDLDPSIHKNIEFLKTSPLLFIVFVLSLVVPFILLIWGIISIYKNNRKAFWLIILTVLPVFVAAFISSEIGPRAARYLSFLVPFYLFFIIYPFILPSKKMPAAYYVLLATFLLIFLASFTNGLYFERTKPGVNKIAKYLTQNANSGDNILIQGGFGGGEEYVLRYYLKEKANNFTIFDLYGDYQVGNLTTLRSRSVSDYIGRLEENSSTVWFYDLTYTFDKNLVDGKKFEPIPLGKDKENKDLILYKFSR